MQQKALKCLKIVFLNVVNDSKLAFKAVEEIQLESTAEIKEFTILMEECITKHLRIHSVIEAIEASIICKFYLPAARKEGKFLFELTEQLSRLPELNACSLIGKFLLYSWKVICTFQGAFGLGNRIVQGIWDAFVKCLREYPHVNAIQLAGSFDSVLLCVMYSICKIFDNDKTFKEIVQVYRQRISLEAAVYLGVRMENEEKQQEKLSILQYYNEHFLPFANEAFQRMRAELKQQTWRGKWTFPLAVPAEKMKRIRSHSVRITDNFCLAVSPKKPALNEMEKGQVSQMKTNLAKRKASLTLSFQESFVGPKKCQRKLEFE
jgi:hypothetical protein